MPPTDNETHDLSKLSDTFATLTTSVSVTGDHVFSWRTEGRHCSFRLLGHEGL
jgi:hypothetical protein